ncbi:helix-turn-helix domain-containing protein [Microtetraspora sp. NBRC 13810]|uniref:ArsR/SmtB family transcription factor n=1 Tax=Microtetraspora sp. NBRC 13810 TaxID=3030990 RepID=UPI00255489B4|nr:helix-turn-helix domain-containing protein [Microtetraspora sp. NBRC 13810]
MERQNRMVDDPRAMRALAHPARLAILSRLQAQGPATATECAAAAEVSPSAASYHLRMLAKYGFVGDAPARADGRERVWQALHRGLTMVENDRAPDSAEAVGEVTRAAMNMWTADVMRFLDRYGGESREWRQASRIGQALLRVDAEELEGLVASMDALLEPYLARDRAPQDAPTGARRVQVLMQMFPLAPERDRA